MGRIKAKKAFFPKISKLNENNQYGFAMTKPLPIVIFKNEAHVDTEILNNSIKNFDPNAKIGEIFIVNIEFTAYYDARKKMYNEVYRCIFEPKTKVSTDRRCVYQLLSTIRMFKKENRKKRQQKKFTQLYLGKKDFRCALIIYIF